MSLFNVSDCQGVILLVYSCIFTRGIANIQSDMDLQDGTLLNEHGYYAATVIPAYIVLVASGALAYVVAGGTRNSLKVLFTLKKKPQTLLANNAADS